MTDTTAASTATSTTIDKSGSRTRTIALWVAQAVLALGFLYGGFLKVTGDAAMVGLFDDIGAGDWLRYLVGVLEIAGGIGLLVPRLRGLAALGLCGLLVGAAITNMALGIGPWIPLGYLVVAVLIARGRWPETRALVAPRHG